MKRMATWLIMFLLLLSGCAKETDQFDSKKVLELLQVYYSPYYVEESGIIENSDGEAYDPNIEMYDVCEDYNEESELAGEKLYEVKVNLATGEAQELGENGSVMDSFNLRDINSASVEEESNDYKEKAKNEKGNTIAAFQGEIEQYKYLDRDERFLFWLRDGEYVITDLNGVIIEDADGKLKSDYLATEDEGIQDIFGNDVEERFIQDAEHEKILSVCRMEDRDVIWVWESQETPLDTKIIIKGFDEEGNELCRINSDDPQIKKENVSDNFKDITHIEYSGDVTCRIVDKNRRDLFSVNIETGELLDPRGEFSDGFAVVEFDHYIQDIHGNTVKELPYDIFKNTANYREGLFFSGTSKKFYDVELNERIDLSDYNISYGGDEWKEEYSFKDGYCGIEALNENGTRFYGVINQKGDWVVEMSDTLSAQGDKYRGKATETKLNLGRRFYDIETKEFTTPPEGFWEKDPDLINGAYYFLNDEEGIFYCYDIDKDIISKVGETEEKDTSGRLQVDSGNEKIDIAHGLGMDWEKFNSEVLQDKFDRKVIKQGVIDCYMENQDRGVICNLANEDDNTIWAISLEEVESPYCIEGVYVGQELSKAEEELEKRKFEFAYDDILDDEAKELYGNKYEYSSTYTNDKEGKEVILFVQEKKIRAVVVN